MSRSWAGGSTRAWRKTRRAVLTANLLTRRGVCQLDVGAMCPKHNHPCPGVCAGHATQAHHARGKAAGDDPAHLVPACAPCNLHVGDPAGHDPDPPPRPRTRW